MEKVPIINSEGQKHAMPDDFITRPTTKIQRGVVELYYNTLKAMDVDSDSDADY